VEITIVEFEKPETAGAILGQSHFIKTVEDIHEVMVGSVPGVKFGLAFCEASGDRLVRVSGTDDELTALAAKNALAIGAGHTFVLMLGEGVFPINVLNAVKMVPEVCRIFCATANPLQVVVAESDQGRGVLGVIDGMSPLGVEDDEHIAARKSLLRVFGYKL
jgi:adenosine/AMP kinase